MKTTIRLLSAFTAAAWLGGCASRPLTLAPVGPEPRAHIPPTGSGYLKVYSDTVDREIGDDSYYYPHRGYFVYPADGGPWQFVPNRVNKLDENPALVKLPAGDYKIVAPATSYGRVNVPVIIRPGQTTVVHLDRNWQPVPGTNPREVVWLPDGEAVGWQAPNYQR